MKYQEAEQGCTSETLLRAPYCFSKAGPILILALSYWVGLSLLITRMGSYHMYACMALTFISQRHVWENTFVVAHSWRSFIFIAV